MSKLTMFTIYGLSVLAGGLAYGLYKAQAVWWGWAGPLVIALLISLWLCHKDEKRADERARNRIAMRHYASLPLGGALQTQRKPFTYRQGRK